GLRRGVNEPAAFRGGTAAAGSAAAQGARSRRVAPRVRHRRARDRAAARPAAGAGHGSRAVVTDGAVGAARRSAIMAARSRKGAGMARISGSWVAYALHAGLRDP